MPAVGTDLTFWYVVAGVFGLLIGSFLNVCILSWGADPKESVRRPRSRCPRCGQQIAWYDNIPVLSWLILGGKCRKAVDTYRHSSGSSLEEVEESVRRYMSQGYRHVRIQMSVPGQSTYGSRGAGGQSRAVVERVNNRISTWGP